MKNKKLLTLWGIETVLIPIITISTVNSQNMLYAFPWIQISGGLRSLSRSSAFGNIISLVLYVLFGLLPTGVLVLRKSQTKLQKLLMGTLSVGFFFGMYLLINNHLVYPFFNASLHGESLITMFTFIMTGLVLAIIFGYWIIEIILTTSNMDTLMRNVNVVLCVFGMLLICSILGIQLNTLIQSFPTPNSFSTEIMPPIDGVYFLFKYTLDVIPNLLALYVIYKVMAVIEAMRVDRHASHTIILVNNLSIITSKTVIFIILLTIFGYITLFLFSKDVSNATFTIEFPFFSLLFALAVLFISKFILENKALKEENEQFI